MARYTYDGLNRLIREDNAHFGTFIYCYDAAGNILSKTAYAYTLNDTLGEIKAENVYSYNQQGWKDQLLSCNDLNCKYDIMGNPTVYKGRNLTWQNNRLISYGIDKKKATYSYDFNGVRTSKTATDGKQTLDCKYIYDGNTLVAEQRNGEWIYYFYGIDGIAGFRYNGTTYLYRKNIQGDITHIYRKDKDTLTLVAQYAYDAYGNTEIKSQTDNIGLLNPFRYRGYYFDIDTKLYYLISRYYDPETGRFISADSIEYLDPETLGGLNLYAYCCNNPVMAIDPEGTKLKWWHWLIAGVVAVASFAFAVATAGVGLAIAGTIAGAATGALYGYGVAVTTGQDVWECIGIGILAGITLSNFATGFVEIANAGLVSVKAALGVNAFLSAGVGLGAEVLSQISADGKVTDWGKAGWSALQWGILNTINFGLGKLTFTPKLPHLDRFATGLIGGYVYNHITGVVGFIIDIIKGGSFNKRRGIVK